MITGAVPHSVGPGVTDGETLARGASGEQLTASGAIQAGIADDGTVLSLVDTGLGRNDDQFAAGHALAHVVVGIAFQVHIQATGVPDAETLACGALETEGDRRLGHALVAVLAGDFAGDPRDRKSTRLKSSHKCASC